MQDKWLEVIKQLMEEHPRIRDRILELNLTNEEAIQALPILLEMSEENENTKALYLTSFERSELGNVRKILILSNEGKRKEYINNILTQKFLPIDFEDEKDYEKLEDRRVLVAEFAKLLKANDLEVVPRGFYIFGPHGVGKTFTLKRFARSLAEKGRKVGFFNTATLVSLFQTVFKSANDEKQEIMDVLKKVDYLFIDDIGSESISTWFRDDILYQILSDRATNRRGTFFSSNYSLEALQKIEAKTSKEKYQDFEKAERLISRIKSSTTIIELKKLPKG